MWPHVLAYLALGCAYWLCSLGAFGFPAEVDSLPPLARRRVQTWTSLLTVLLWPLALSYDLTQRLLRWFSA